MTERVDYIHERISDDEESSEFVMWVVSVNGYGEVISSACPSISPGVLEHPIPAELQQATTHPFLRNSIIKRVAKDTSGYKSSTLSISSSAISFADF